jgi:hypothetical protein
MTTDALTPPIAVDERSSPGPGPEVPRPSRSAARRQRQASTRRSRRGLVAALVICAAAPTAVVLSLWSNLTEPFWFNEQWRAYFISNSTNWWAALKTDNAPFPAAWFFLERASGAVFGSTELTLRLPTAAFLPISGVLFLLLARRWMPLIPAVLLSLLGTFAGCLIGYAIQLSEYQIDAAAVVTVLLLHELAWEGDDPGWRSRRVLLAYAGLTVACFFSTPAVFIAGPILLLDVGRSAWRRTITLRAVAAVVSGVLILLQLVLFVLPQNALTSSDYWDANFIPHSGLAKQLSFVWDGLTGFVTGPFTQSAQGEAPGLLVGTNHAWLLDLVFGALLLLGAMVMARSERGRTILFALVSSVVLTLIASYQRYWPFGFVRTNYYEVPILVLLAGVGAVTTGRWAVARVRRWRGSGASGPLFATLAAAVCVVVLVGTAFAVNFEVSAYRQARASITAPAFGNQINEAVADVRAKSHPGDVVVVSGFMAMDGWNYYQFDYSGKSADSGAPIAASHVVITPDHGSKAISHLVAKYRPGAVFYYFPWGTTQQEINQDFSAISTGSPDCVRSDGINFSFSGMLIPLHCAAP